MDKNKIFIVFGFIILVVKVWACDYTISLDGQFFTSNGGTGSALVSTDADCNWNAVSNETWISGLTPVAGKGETVVTFNVNSNASEDSRTGTITIAAQTFTITQSGKTFTHFEEINAKANRRYDQSYKNITEAITTNSGAFYFSMPLLKLGGPMQLGFSLIYSSDMQNAITRIPNDFPGPDRDNNTRFWWSPRCQAKYDQDDYWTFWLENGEMVAFKKNGADWVIYEGVQTQADNGQPWGYDLKETDTQLMLLAPHKSRIYIFTKTGRIISIRDRNNNRLTYNYAADQHNNPARISDGLGRELNFTYTNGLTAVSDQEGRVVKMVYQNDPDNNNSLSLHSVIDAMGNTTVFSYQAIMEEDKVFLDNITALKHPEGSIPYMRTYDLVYSETSGIRVMQQTDAYNNRTGLSYDLEQTITHENKPGNIDETHYYHSPHSIAKQWTDTARHSAFFERNQHEQITTVIDRSGGSTQLSFHSVCGKPTLIINAEGQELTLLYTLQIQNIDGVDFSFYNLGQVNYPDGTKEIFSHDGRGNIQIYKDRTGHEWSNTYNDDGMMLTSTNPDGGVFLCTYNTDQTMASMTDSDTSNIIFNYDNLKRLTKIIYPDGSFMEKNYNLNDRVINEQNRRGHTVVYDYDANGNLIKSNTMQSSYDLMNRPTKIGSTDLTWDALSRIISIQYPHLSMGFNYSGDFLTSMSRGNRTLNLGYNSGGLISNANAVTYQRNQTGHITAVTNGTDHTTQLTRDTMQRLTTVTDPLNRTLMYQYDPHGRLISTKIPVVDQVSFSRSSSGLIQSLTTPNANKWSFNYTKMGRMTTMIDPLNRARQYSHDTEGRCSKINFPDGQSVTYQYDGDNLNLVYSNGLDLGLTYDQESRLVGASSLTLMRNAAGLITRTTDNGVNCDAEYQNQLLVKISYPRADGSNFFVNYTYINGQVHKVSDDLTATILTFTYNNDGHLTGITRSNEVDSSLSYNHAGELVRIQSGDIIDIQYARDAAGQIISTDQTLPLDPVDELGSYVNAYTYDQADQVSTEKFQYDSRGRLTASGSHNLTWDSASRLTGVNGVNLSYNGLNAFKARTENGNTTYYYYNYAVNQGAMVAEQSAGQYLRYFVWTPEGRLLYMIDGLNQDVYFYHFDGHGTTMALTDYKGRVSDAYIYSVYGRLLKHDGINQQPFTFLGQKGVRQEGQSGTLYYIGGRYYDAETVRFLTCKPVWPASSDPRQINPYQFAMQNPLKILPREYFYTTPMEIKKEEQKFKLQRPDYPQIIAAHTGLYEAPREIWKRIVCDLTELNNYELQVTNDELIKPTKMNYLPGDVNIKFDFKIENYESERRKFRETIYF